MNRVTTFSLIPTIGLAVLSLFSAGSPTAAEEGKTKLSLKTDYLFAKFEIIKDYRKVHSLTLHASLDEKGGQGVLACDPTRRDHNEFGDTTGSTDIAPHQVEVTLERVKRDDPEKKGRRIYEIKGKDLKGQVFLVVSPTEAEPNRLIVRGKESESVFPLHDASKR